MKRARLFAGMIPLLSISIFAGGCAVKTPVQVRSDRTARDVIEHLCSDLERIFADPNFNTAQWGVEVVSLDRGEILFERNSSRLYMPASNNKLLTSAAALVRLGPDYRFETRILAGGEIAGGVLKGNLEIVGSGDPSHSPRFHSGDAFAVFKEWAARLKDKGIRKIEGDLLGDDRAFEPVLLGKGWEWDDLVYGYAAPVSALQFNDNLVSLEITPADRQGIPPAVKILPLQDYLTADCRLTTAPAGSEAEIDAERAETGESVIISGSVPLSGGPVTRTLAVRYPTLYYLRALKQTLQGEGVDVSACNIRTVERAAAASPAASLLWTHSSPPLSEILKPLLKVSQNLYAETLTRTLALAAGREGSFTLGKEIVEETLRGMAIERGTYHYADGSGLSRLNLVSADLLVRILRFMYRHKYFSQFYEALPVAGIDGTIAGRMKGTRAENNVHAKTGTIAQVRSLSGYVRTSEGEMLAFSMIANNFLASNKAAEYVQDLALERIANFSRK